MAKKRKIIIRDLTKNGGQVWGWLWEFSKKVVVITSVLYFISCVYAMVTCFMAVRLVADTAAVSTFITESNETFRAVVGGYLIKAAVENASKIITSKIAKEEGKEQPEREVDIL